MIYRRLLPLVLVLLALTLSGCGKLIPGQNNAQKGSLSVVIRIPTHAGMSAQSFLEEIDLDRVEVTLSGTTSITGSATINDSIAAQ